MKTKEINFINMNIKDFIDYIITFDNIDDILDNCKTQSEKGFLFERLFDIFIKFGFCSIFPNSNFIHLIGNSNNAKLKILENINQYLNEKVLSSNSGGCSDITLQNKNDDTYIFISSKYPKSNEDIKKQKSVDYYDIQNIIAMATKNKHIYKNYKIYLVVPNKKTVLDKVKNTNKSSEYITEHMTDNNILDKCDLNKYFLAFKQDIIKNKNNDWQTIYLNSKENLILRFHQELITQKTSTLIDEGNKSFLWGCKCRSGKTYMFGGIITKQFNIKKKLNVLIITPAPTETIPQFTNDLFNKFKDFDKFKIHYIEGSKMINNIESSDNNIFVMSKQLLQKYINDKTIMKIKNLKLDIIGFDENHFSGTTDLSKNILRSYSSKNTIKIYLTATYNKPLKEWNILPECQMYWDIEDEQFCKSILIDENNLDKLKEKHGSEYIEKTIKYYTNLGLSLNDIFKCYEKMPDLHLITNMFDQQRYEIIKEKLNNENKFGFCFDSLFGLNKLKTKFSFTNEVKTILRYISGSYKEEDGEKTIFTRINNICSEKETRLPFTQIWFLPSNNINEISECLKKLMLEDIILKRYDILCINRKNKELAKDIKDEINKRETIAMSTGKLGLILLAGNMLTLGITLNLCDLVILMNNALSSDKVLQQMYRCMSEFIPNSIIGCENKKIGFVVDLNINRVLNTCINYTVCKNEKSIDDKIKYLIINHLINIDVDMILNKKINSDMIIKKLMEIWKEDPINSFKILLKKLDNDYEDFDNLTQKLINKTFTKSLKDDKVNLQLRLKDEYDEIQDLPSGKEKVKNDSDSESIEQYNTEKSNEEKEIQISFTKDVLQYIIPLTCILTIKNSNMDFIGMLNDIKENQELLDTFDNQCLIWWNKKDLIDLIKDIVNKYFDKNSNTYNISIQFKMSLQSLIDNPKELLELITECLKPKYIEKKQFGEVFTPMILVNEMLDKLPKEVWINKYLKWLDPCCGMGNFPIAVYLRLIEGLKEEIKDMNERKKYILENMLYMCELNKKNVLVCKQIFDINNEYKLNIYEGDSLNLNYNKEFKVKQFDIIIGSPPYQKENKKNDTARGGTNNNLYLEFINNAISLLKKDGYLLFIHPLNWRKIGSKIFTEFINRNIHYLKLNYGGKFFENVSVKTDYYVLKNSHIKNYKSIIEYINNKEIVISNIILSNTLKFIPNIFNEHINSILDKINIYGKQYECIISSDCHKTRPHVKKGNTEIFKYPLFNTSGNPFEYFSSKPHKNQYSKKIILSNSGKLSPFYDEGILGTTQDSMYILINSKEEGNILINTINSKLFTFLIQICQWGNFRNEASLFTYFK
jgi:SAM-dependent methyltransferase